MSEIGTRLDNQKPKTSNFALYALFFSILGFCGGCSSVDAEHKMIPDSIVRQVLNHKDLQHFLHPQIEGRVPVVIADHLVKSDLEVWMFGKAVKVLPESELSDRAFLRFTDFKVKGNKATVALEYKVEGVWAKYVFVYTSEGKWELKEGEVWEYQERKI